MEMEDVSAATAIRIKKRTQKKNPPGIWAKRLRRVIKTRLGPALGSTAKARTAGKMAIPDRIAIRVSASVTCNAVAPIFSL